jgi:hypothetical protein
MDGDGDLRSLALQASSKMPIRDPRTFLPWVFPDKSPCFIEIANPDGERYLQAYYEHIDRMRAADVITARMRHEEKIFLAASATLNWNIRLDGEALACNFDEAKRLYGSPEFSFLCDQVTSWLDGRRNFMLPLPETSDGSPKTGETA